MSAPRRRAQTSEEVGRDADAATLLSRAVLVAHRRMLYRIAAAVIAPAMIGATLLLVC